MKSTDIKKEIDKKKQEFVGLSEKLGIKELCYRAGITPGQFYRFRKHKKFDTDFLLQMCEKLGI